MRQTILIKSAANNGRGRSLAMKLGHKDCHCQGAARTLQKPSI